MTTDTVGISVAAMRGTPVRPENRNRFIPPDFFGRGLEALPEVFPRMPNAQDDDQAFIPAEMVADEIIVHDEITNVRTSVRRDANQWMLLQLCGRTFKAIHDSLCRLWIVLPNKCP